MLGRGRGRRHGGVPGRCVLLVLVLAALLGACFGRGGDGDHGTGPTVPPGGTSSTTSTTAVSYDVPAVIDLAYVQRVVSAFDHALGDAIRVLVRDRAMSDEFLQYLVGLYTEPEFETQQRAWSESVASGFIERTASPPGDPKTTVFRLERSDPKCIIVRADRDYAATLKRGETQPVTAQDDYLVLVAKGTNRDPLAINPTPWRMSFDGYKNDNTIPLNSCDD